MNNDIKFLNIVWRALYSLTNSEDCFGLYASFIFLYSHMCGFIYICMLACSQTLVVKRMAWQLAEILMEIRGTLADIRGTTK